MTYPEYISSALSAFRPPERLTVSEWADKYRVLSEKDTAAPGKWNTSKTPYLRGVMDAFNNRRIQDITFCAGTQVGKTSAEQNMIGYAIDQDPGPMMIVYPTDKLAEFTSENRLKPMLRLSPPLAEKFMENDSQRLELQFPQMYIALIGANSPANLSSRPVRYVFFDEIDKFPKWTGDEASPMELAAERKHSGTGSWSGYLLPHWKLGISGKRGCGQMHSTNILFRARSAGHTSSWK